MYAAKQAGSNQFQYFTQAIQEEAIARRELTENIHLALTNN